MWLAKYSIDSSDSIALRAAIQNSLESAGVMLSDVALAVSGGPDSAMLAVECAVLANMCGVKPNIFHVHHGLQDSADTWQSKVHDLAHILGVSCHSIKANVASTAGIGIEAAARKARYEAISNMADQLNIKHIILAHHRDDQAETVLLRLLRGSGPSGLSAMAPIIERDGINYLRPWLNVSRLSIMQQMQAFIMATGWSPVYDPTNYDQKYTRSAVRELLAPALDRRWPSWQSILARHAEHAAQTTEILLEVGNEDFSKLDPDPSGLSFSLQKWRDLSRARQAHVLRFWFDRHGLRAPTHARLNNLMRQMRTLHALGHDRHMQVKHDGAVVKCHRGRVSLELK